MKAILKNYHQSPRKVRLVADLIKGKKVSDALVELNFLTKRASLPIRELIASAVANASHNFNLDKNELFVKELRVDKGIVMKRMLPGARGQGRGIKMRTSHVSVLLDIKPVDEKKTKAKKVAVAKDDKKPVAKKAVKKVAKTKKAEAK